MPERINAVVAIGNRAGEVAVDPRWWERFHDPVLNTLVTAAAASNHDVRTALAQAEEARAELGAATADLLPRLDAAGTWKRNTTGYGPAIRQQLPDIRASQAGLQASWEIDLFGRARAARRAAAADALAAADAHRGAILIAIAETADQYFALRGAQLQRQIVAELIKSEHETLRLTELRHARGSASDFDVDRVRGELADREALLPTLDSLITMSRNHIALLIGQPPGTWMDPIEEVADARDIPGIPVAQPVELLRRRPDLLAADAMLAAAGFRQDQARALQFPQLVVSALIGSQWTEVNGISIGRARFANAAGALAIPLFEGGRVRAGIKAADAAQREAVARYEHALLSALEDVEGAVTSYGNDRRRRTSILQAIDSRVAATSKAHALYQAGEIDLLQLLDVERSLLSSRIDGSVNETALLTDVVKTYKALGGGWESFSDETASASAPPVNRTVGGETPPPRTMP